MSSHIENLDQHLLDCTNSLLHLTLGVSRKVQAFGSDSPSMPHITWDGPSHYKAQVVDGKILSIDMLSQFCNTLYLEAMDLLQSEILLGANVPCLGDPIHPNNTVYSDKLQNTTLGYSFLTDVENKTLVREETKWFILQHIFSVQSLRQEFFGPSNTTPNFIRYSAWLGTVGKFVEILAVLCHVTSGQPTRGTEVTTSMIINSSSGSPRSVYWTHNTIMLTQHYNKTSSVHGDQYIARFLPKPIAHLFVLYLAVVRPMEK